MCQCGYSFRIESELAYWHIDTLAHWHIINIILSDRELGYT